MKKCLSVIFAGVLFFSLSGSNTDTLFTAVPKGVREIMIPPGEHKIHKTVEVTADLRVVFSHGAILHSENSPMFRVKSGRLTLEGLGNGGIIRCTAKFGGMQSPQRGSVIDLNSSFSKNGKTPASVFLKNIEIHAPYGIDGTFRHTDMKKIGSLKIDNCRFFCQFRGIGIFNAQVADCRITDSSFDGGEAGIYINARIPGGAYVCGNTIKNFGKSGIVLGKTGQIAEGITSFLPMAQVHDNRLLRGGFESTVKDSYIHGILVMGHNVSVQGNIVRDVNRGVPVPGMKYGHQIIENGKIYKERMRKSGKTQIRLAGSAIYLKANRAIVHSNICTNSGWRSVIEIKTGGKEHFTSVVNNVVDGRSLAIDDSFAFECNSGRSLWANNIVYNVPHQAFIVRCGYENTFMNNLIVNAKVGFALSGNPRGEKELINGNRFINVQCPVSLNGAAPSPAAGADIHKMPHSYITPDTELPPPSSENAGRIIIRGKSLFCCVRTDDKFAWMELNGKIVPEKKWLPIGPELAVNADQSGRGNIPAELNNPLHPGWKMSMMSAREAVLSPADGHVTFDNKNYLTGNRSLKVKFINTTGLFHLTQVIKIVPGKRYRVSATVRGEEPETLTLSIRTDKGFARSVRAKDSDKWQTLTFDFPVPAGHKSCVLLISGGKMSANKTAHIDSVSFRELAEESAVKISKSKPVGNNLIQPEKHWKIVPGKKLLNTDFKNGIITLSARQKMINALLSQKVKLASGKSYRLEFDCRSEEKLAVTTGIKTSSVKLQKNFESSSKWQTYTMEITIPSGANTDVLTIWIGKIAPGKTISFRNISCRELEN